jgi:hypothetical protein
VKRKKTYGFVAKAGFERDIPLWEEVVVLTIPSLWEVFACWDLLLRRYIYISQIIGRFFGIVSIDKKVYTQEKRFKYFSKLFKNFYLFISRY